MKRAILLLFVVAASLGEARGQGWVPGGPKVGAAAKRSSATTAPQPRQKALVYVYRLKQFTGGAAAPSIHCDGNELAKIDNGRYFVARLSPGRHSCGGDDLEPQSIELQAKPGGKYYIRVEMAKRFWKGQNRITLVAPEQGLGEVKKLKSLDADKIADMSLVAVPGEDDDALVDRDETKAAKSEWE
jgi:hypothetical protein